SVYADRRPWGVGTGLVIAGASVLVRAVLRRLPRPEPEVAGAARRAVAITLALVGASSWALWLAVYGPAVQDLRSIPALVVWVTDVRWVSIVVGVGGLVLTAGGPRWRR